MYLAEGAKDGPFYVTQTGISCSGMIFGHADGYGQQARFDASRAVRAGSETRPSNITVKIWKRIF